MATNPTTAAVPEIDPAAFEQELRDGADVLVVDVRSPGDYAGWNLDEPARIVNIPIERIRTDPQVIARHAAGRTVRLICTRGNASREAAELVAGTPVASVAGGMLAWGRLLRSEPVPLPVSAQVIQFRREARGCLSYLVHSDGQAVVVDPAPDVDAYLDAAAAAGAVIGHVIDTHVHADHLSGARALADATGASLHVSTNALRRGIADPDRFTPLSDGETITLGAVTLQVVALPGHTSDNIGITIAGVAVIAGDSLFTDAIARPDLEVGDDGALDAARRLHATLHDRIFTLHDDVAILPCHYPGGRRTGPVITTVGRARRDIGLAQLDRETFARDLIAAMPPRPANYQEIIAVNLEGADMGDAAGLEVGANNCAATVTG